MSREFKIFKLGQVANIFAGGDKPKSFSEVKINEFKIPVYANGETNDGLQGYTEKAKVFESAVTVSARGTIGYTVLRKEPFVPIVRLLTLIPNAEQLDISFLYYYLSLYRQKGIGSSQSQLTVPDLSNRTISIPALYTQKSIGKVLTDLDAKIEVNNKINQELEAMAKTLYDYWFVQFDFPDENGKPYKSSGGKMIYNEELKREIPIGWKSGVLSDIANITMGQSPAGSSYNEEGIGTVFYQGSTDFGARFPTIRKYTTEPSRMAKKGDILLSVRAPVGTLNQAMENCCIGRGLAALHEKVGSVSFLWSQMEYFKQTFDRRNVSGTTFGSITKDDLYGLKLCIPVKETLKRFKKIADPLHDKIILNSKQNQKLAELRDWLLPMLMNGQVTVGEGYDENKEELRMVAEPPASYNKDKTLEDLFPESNLYAEVACLLAIEKEINSISRGKTWVQKTANHLKEIKKEPKLKNVPFEEYYWGMYSTNIAQALDSNPFLIKESNGGATVYKLRSNKIAEIKMWMQEPRNSSFVESARAIVSLYNHPLILNKLDRIELLNTVYRCMQKLGTSDFNSIYQAMREWPMQEQGYANKAEKFKPEETRHMIRFVKNEILK